MEPPLRVLHVVNSLDPGGMENGVTNLARGLAPHGFETHVACIDHGGQFIERLPRQDFAHILGKPPGFSAAAAWQLNRLIRRTRPAVVHSHNLGPLIYSGLATIYGRTVPLLHGEHGQLPAAQQSARSLRQRRVFYGACARIHTVSNGLKEHLAGLHLPVEKVVPILNGVDTERFCPGNRTFARAQLDLPADALIIGIVGRFVGLKRHTTLIEAFEALLAVHPKAYLLIVGEGGPETSTIHSRVTASPARERIRLLGHQKDTVAAYQSLDVLAAPSVIEGLSNVVLEAMACGVPVLAHTACGNAEAITSPTDGVVADLGTSEALRDQLARLLGNPGELAALGAEARKKVLKHFSIRRMLAQYARLYAGLAGRTLTGTATD